MRSHFPRLRVLVSSEIWNSEDSQGQILAVDFKVSKKLKLVVLASELGDWRAASSNL